MEPADAAKESISKAALDVMEQTLKVDSIACQESSLHGLGHGARYYPVEVGAIIDRYVANHPSLRRELKQYALKAREGNVL